MLALLCVGCRSNVYAGMPTFAFSNRAFCVQSSRSEIQAIQRSVENFCSVFLVTLQPLHVKEWLKNEPEHSIYGIEKSKFKP
ncbi:hypothetical protein RN22_04210 [Grimontia sp. AD028]|nr:hypothetical protein RN22_04210 [Grimontia sp. AD028]